MGRKFDYDYNFDPAGTSPVKQDPYADKSWPSGNWPRANPQTHRVTRDPYLDLISSPEPPEPVWRRSRNQETHNTGSTPTYHHSMATTPTRPRRKSPDYTLGSCPDPRSSPDYTTGARFRSPTPPTKPKPLAPSPEYLSISLETSLKITPSDSSSPSSSTQRKLLILDLNGTLVFRSPHQRRGAYQLHGSARPLRSVHRRPYLESFTRYLFHPDVRSWLDTMVWSSAQPHSVNDMVAQCFADKRGELAAVWARDTLGLSPEEYCT